MSRSLANFLIGMVAYLSLAAIAAAALLTGADIVLRHTVGSPIRGLVDLTQLAVMYSVFLAIAYGFARASHVGVTVLTDTFPKKINRFLAAFWWLAAVPLLGLLGWASLGQAKLILEYGDVSQNIRIPMILYWLPVVVGFVLAALGALWASIETLRASDNLEEQA